MNKLFFGDNLDVLREHISDECIDLVYFDPPFNSSVGYVGETAEQSFDDVMAGGGDLAIFLKALRNGLNQSPMMAYLAMMAARIKELHRSLKTTGSLYLHCDPTVVHYIKIILDSVFGSQNFLNEIIWKRTGAHSAANRWGDVHDNIL